MEPETREKNGPNRQKYGARDLRNMPSSLLLRSRFHFIGRFSFSFGVVAMQSFDYPEPLRSSIVHQVCQDLKVVKKWRSLQVVEGQYRHVFYRTTIVEYPS